MVGTNVPRNQNQPTTSHLCPRRAAQIAAAADSASTRPAAAADQVNAALGIG